MTVIKKSSTLNAVACGYLGRLLRAMPGTLSSLREMEPHQLAEFELTQATVANRQGLMALLKERSTAPKPGYLWKNSELLDLQVGEGSPLSLSLLRFVCIYTLHSGLQEVISDVGYLDRQRSRLPLLAALIGHPAELAMDGNPDTWWEAGRGSNGGLLTLELPKESRFDVVSLQEAVGQRSQRIESFVVEVWNGSDWIAPVASSHRCSTPLRSPLAKFCGLNACSR